MRIIILALLFVPLIIIAIAPALHRRDKRQGQPWTKGDV